MVSTPICVKEKIMESACFDALATRLSHHLTRRRTLALLGIGGIPGLGMIEDGKAKKKKHKKKKQQPVPTTQPPASVERLTGACAGPPSGSGSFGNGRRSAATFVAQRSGRLTRAHITIATNGGGGDITFEIRNVGSDQLPTTVRATCVAVDVPFVDGSFPLSCTFPSPTTVVAGGRYALVVTTSLSDTLRLTAHVINGVDKCPESRFYLDLQADETYVEYPYDIIFETYVTE